MASPRSRCPLASGGASSDSLMQLTSHRNEIVKTKHEWHKQLALRLLPGIMMGRWSEKCWIYVVHVVMGSSDKDLIQQL